MVYDHEKEGVFTTEWDEGDTEVPMWMQYTGKTALVVFLLMFAGIMLAEVFVR